MKTTKLYKFIELCNIAREKEKNSYGVNEIEKELLDVLNYIKTDKENKNKIKQFLIKIIKGIELYPIEIIIFCMRELQWPEIKEGAIDEKNKTDDWRIISSMDDILAVYETNWEDSDLYKYYSEKEKD